MTQHLEIIAGAVTILALFVTVVGQFFSQKHKIEGLEEVQLEHEGRLTKTEEAIVAIKKSEAESLVTRKNMEAILQENRSDIKFLAKEVTAISGMLTVILKDKKD